MLGSTRATEHRHATLGEGLRSGCDDAIIDVGLMRRLTQTALPYFIGNFQVHHGGTSLQQRVKKALGGCPLGAFAQGITFIHRQSARLHQQIHSFCKGHIVVGDA